MNPDNANGRAPQPEWNDGKQEGTFSTGEWDARSGQPETTHCTAEEKVGKKRRFSPDQIIAMLREAEVRQSHGERIGAICETFGISEQSYYRWRRQFGGLRPDQAQRMQQLEQENARLRKTVSALSLDKAILCDALSRNF